MLTLPFPWQPEHPLKRSVVVSVRASLEDLCLRKAKATWSPSTEATAAILKQQKFIDLQGTSEKQGDLKVNNPHNQPVAPHTN